MSGGWTAKKEENGLPPSEDSPAASAPQMRTARSCVCQLKAPAEDREE
ncbi:rCG33425, isoform CRA_d [Rattus norvegicus]|uniref:RCG33425, isoform CRA_d n=1 Tax=Rattus norvegicus TaxID=10116 RepID=A6HEE9_RAT|nr:rCG33425, isoform CRA_d [Rattus norvegicus]